MFYDKLKRAIDLAVASTGLVATSPILAATAVGIKLDSDGPVFYMGERIGLGGQPFKVFKFRTMVVEGDKRGGPSTSDADDRITRMGKVIRKYKLDELPQLINVFLGEMSLVGPRPEVKVYVDMYTDDEKEILSVKPGITDWASIWNNDEGEVLANSGYEDPEQAYMELIRPEKLRLQRKYVQNRSLMVDLRILFKTASTIISTRA